MIFKRLENMSLIKKLSIRKYWVKFGGIKKIARSPPLVRNPEHDNKVENGENIRIRQGAVNALSEMTDRFEAGFHKICKTAAHAFRPRMLSSADLERVQQHEGKPSLWTSEPVAGRRMRAQGVMVFLFFGKKEIMSMMLTARRELLKVLRDGSKITLTQNRTAYA